MQNEKTKKLLCLLKGGLFFILSVLSIGYAMTALSAGASERFSLILPHDGTLVEGNLISVVIRLNSGGVDSVRITRNNSEILNRAPSKGSEYLCETIALDYGPNVITVSVIEKGAAAASKKITVFFRSDISREFSIAPPEFQKRPFHYGENEISCGACHKMELKEENMKPSKPEDSVCYQCHGKITSYSNVHGPAARWACFTCHERDSQPLRYSTKKPEKNLCFVCHKEKKEEWESKKYMHGPTASGKCSICHNPHASNNPFWLKKPSWELCINCHEDRASGVHVIVGFGSGSHPTKGKPDPLRYGKELSCASCHNPHASNSRSLFVNDEDDLYNLCKACHKV